MNQKSDRFKVGNAYFIVTFVDEDLTVPVVQTVVYKESGKRSDGSAYYLFDELHADRKSSRFIVDLKHANELVADPNALIAKLRKCFKGQLPSSPSED